MDPYKMMCDELKAEAEWGGQTISSHFGEQDEVGTWTTSTSIWYGGNTNMKRFKLKLVRMVYAGWRGYLEEEDSRELRSMMEFLYRGGSEFLYLKLGSSIGEN